MRHRYLGLGLLGGVALSARLATLWLLWTPPTPPMAYEHGQIAQNLLNGKGFSIKFLGTEGPTSQQAPFYPYLVAACYGLFGIATPEAFLAIQLLQAVVGTGLVLALVGLAWAMLPDRPAVGWIAGALAALFPVHLYAVTHLQVAIWAATGLTSLLWLWVSPKTAGRLRGVILAGLLGGAVLLIDPILVLAWPIGLLVFYQAERRGHPEARWYQTGWRTGLMIVVALAVITPWTVRNWQVHGELIFIKDTFGYAFWQGNNPHSWGTDKIPTAWAQQVMSQPKASLASQNQALWQARLQTLYIDDVVLKPTGYREFEGLSEPQRSRLLGRRAWQFIRQHPNRYLQLVVWRLGYFLFWDQTNPKAAHWVYRVSSLAWLAGAVAGWLSSWAFRPRFWPTWAIALLFILFHSLVITSARFRIPIEPIGLLWAGLALDTVGRAARRLAWSLLQETPY